MKRLVWLLALLAVLPASAALAVVPSTMSYQGVLTDVSGNLVPNGNYNLTFRIYDVAVGGVALYTEAHAAVPVQKGGFSVLIGSSTPIALPFDQPYWLGIQVAADAELAPRIPLAASPYGLSLRLPFSGGASSTDPVLDIENTGSGAAIRANGRLESGSPTKTGGFDLFENGATNPIVSLHGSSGGRILGRQSDGSVAYRLEEDANGSGGFFDVGRSATVAGFVVDGNGSGTEQPSVQINGSTRSATFNMGAIGNASVILPGDAIGSTEMVDEPGIGHTNSSSVPLTSTTSTLASRSITCPANGYVLVLGSVDVAINHSTGSSSIATMGVSTTPTTLPAEQDFQMNLPPGAPTGTWDSTIGAHGVFPVSAGLNTFYLNGRATTGGSATAFDINLTVLFFPTSYGVVDPPAPPSALSGNESAATSHAPSAGDLAAERSRAETFNAARVQRELDEIRRELRELKQDVSGNGQLADEN